jgi:hypothetical protein
MGGQGGHVKAVPVRQVVTATLISSRQPSRYSTASILFTIVMIRTWWDRNMRHRLI